MNKNNDTIFALSTPPGKSAIAIIRISGPKAHQYILKISSNMPKKNNQATFNKILDKFLEDIIKIKMFRLNLTFDNNGVIIKK